jgi:DNA gyrase subunit B
MIEVIERSRRSRDVVVAASRDDRLDAEAFGEPDRLREIAASLQSELESMENVDEISIQVIEKTPGEMPVILVENINEQKMKIKTELSLDFCTSPEFIEVRRLGHELADAGSAPFAIVNGDERMEKSSLPEAVRKIMSDARKGLDIQRYKGLGEMNPEQLWETTMDPEKRTLLEVRVEDVPEADLIFSTLMGDAVEPRKEFIQSHASSVKNLDI